MIAVDKDMSLTLTGTGDVISEPVDGVIGALMLHTLRAFCTLRCLRCSMVCCSAVQVLVPAVSLQSRQRAL